MTIIAMSLINH